MKKIILTGSSGFVGENFKKAFGKSFLITPVSLRNASLENLDLSTTDVIVHLAGKAHDLKKVNNPKDYYEINTRLTEKIYDQFMASESSVFITLSSVKAVADSVEGILTEETTPEPKTHYGKSKLLAEQYIFSKPLPDNKRVYVLRPCMIHGAGNKGNLNLLYQVVKKGIPYPLGSFDNKRSFLNIDNLNFVLNQLIEREDIPSGIYNVADDVPLSTNELIKIIGMGLGRNVSILKIPQSVVNLVAKIGTALRLPFNKERLQKLSENYIVDNTKLLKALKQPLPITTKEGLIKTIQSFQQ